LNKVSAKYVHWRNKMK